MKKSFLLIAATVLQVGLFAQTKVGDVTLQNTFKCGESQLTLNGGGIREKYFMDMYVGALYLQKKSKDAAQIMKADEAMSIQLNIISSLISSEKMNTAVDEGFAKSTKGKQAQYAEKIKQFKAVFAEAIQVGDVYDICYCPGKGTEVYRNKKLHTTIPGLDFKQALFGIWFCDEPADEDLKEGMLGIED